MAWSKELANYQHELLLSRWSGYLMAILSMEDWDRELVPEMSSSQWLPAAGAVLAEQRP